MRAVRSRPRAMSVRLPRALPLDIGGIALAHLIQPRGRVAVDSGTQLALEHRKQLVDERPPTCHPLEIGSAAVVVGAIEARTGNPLDEPVKDRLVADVHAQGHLRLLTVTAE